MKIDGGTSGFESNVVIDNDITSSSAAHLVTYTDKGLVTGGREISSADLPIATTSSIGAISVDADEFSVSPVGLLRLKNQISGGTHAVVTYNSQGLITSGKDLTEDDIPDLSASKITSGEFGTDLI